MPDDRPNVVVRDLHQEEQERLRMVERFQYSSPNDNPTQSFCDRCKLVNFQAVFEFINSQSVLPPTTVAVIGSIHRSMLTSACSCCIFWAQVVFLNKTYPWDKATGCYLQAQTCKAPDSAGESLDSDRAYHRCLKLHCSGPNVKHGDNWRFGPLAEHLVFPAGPTDGSSWAFWNNCAYARRIEQWSIDYTGIIRCLKQCEANHPRCTANKPSSWTTLIDCQADPPILVDESTSRHYVALSYCLGTTKLNIVIRESATGRHVDMDSTPQTIRDAIFVTRRLPWRYLWVDAICIDPRYPSKRQELINKMDSVYSNAQLVLCAMGDHADTGLYGVSTPRSPQPQLNVNGRSLVSTMSTLREVLQNSRWATRCWTYQEALLARRCLFFTPEQCYFVCQTSSAYEVLVEDLPREADSRIDLYALRSTLFRLRGTSKHDLEITEDVREYTVRDLSLDSDFLNGFRGVLRQRELFSLCGVISLPQGGPLEDQDTEGPLWSMRHEIGFAFGLFWAAGDRSFAMTPGQPRTNRRLGFPSWSWLSSRGVVDMTWSNPRDYMHDFSGVDIHASFSVQLGSERTVSLTSEWLHMSSRDELDKALVLRPSEHLQITSHVMKVRFVRPTQPVMLFEYWLDLSGPPAIFALDDSDPGRIGPSCLCSATLHFAAGEHRPIGDQEEIGFDKEAFSDPTLGDRILTNDFELLLLVSHAFEGRQLNYWLILDVQEGLRKRIGTARCPGYRYTDNLDLPESYGVLPKTTITMV
ncbi:hypothetical protein PV04_06625 [Phialophora macrospora]|uniref:Heterokaryon incompatibility domain-containing protein n=1 Tax=Phialophora macrospora TaxID=1851006 RepID=A0A0D2G5U1_9EURO|nr:hypothetical protein PV04_06625 [Phialophora macrospora]